MENNDCLWRNKIMDITNGDILYHILLKNTAKHIYIDDYYVKALISREWWDAPYKGGPIDDMIQEIIKEIMEENNEK